MSKKKLTRYKDVIVLMWLMFTTTLSALGYLTPQDIELAMTQAEILEALQIKLNSSFSLLSKSCSYWVEKVGSYYCLGNGSNGHLEDYSTDATTVINWALGNLTSSRTWKEKVCFKGEFEIDYTNEQLWIPNYTILDFAGSILKVKDGVEDPGYDVGIFRNEDTSATDIEIRNLIFDENSAGAPSGWCYILWFNNTQNVLVDNCDFRSPDLGYGFWFDEPYSRNIKISDCQFQLNWPELYVHELMFIGNKINQDIVYSYGKNSLIQGNNITHTTTYSKLLVYGERTTVDSNFAVGAISLQLRADYCTMSNNIVNRTDDAAGQAILYASGDYLVFSNNIVIGNDAGDEWTSYGIDVGAGGNHLLFVNNIVESCAVGITLDVGSGTNVFSNVVYNCSKGIHASSATDSTMKNNVIDTCDIGVYLRTAASQDHHVEGNTFISCTTEVTDDGSGNVFKRNVGFVTENSGVSELSNDDWFAHGCAGEPDYTYLNIEETDANYCLQLKAKNSTHCQIYLYDLTADALETVDKTIHWRVIYEP